ncbi:hypothetical protein NMY22_g19859 [Coprinellus aureogranulatus]|nr:hypothetical protein NMY22_g19859 [Coprinellus aureogranulatus]
METVVDHSRLSSPITHALPPLHPPSPLDGCAGACSRLHQTRPSEISQFQCTGRPLRQLSVPELRLRRCLDQSNPLASNGGANMMNELRRVVAGDGRTTRWLVRPRYINFEAHDAFESVTPSVVSSRAIITSQRRVLLFPLQTRDGGKGRGSCKSLPHAGTIGTGTTDTSKPIHSSIMKIPASSSLILTTLALSSSSASLAAPTGEVPTSTSSSLHHPNAGQAMENEEKADGHMVERDSENNSIETRTPGLVIDVLGKIPVVGPMVVPMLAKECSPNSNDPEASEADPAALQRLQDAVGTLSSILSGVLPTGVPVAVVQGWLRPRHH